MAKPRWINCFARHFETKTPQKASNDTEKSDKFTQSDVSQVTKISLKNAKM
jgi:hypothetical protein